MITRVERRNRAMERAEEAMAELLQAAEAFAKPQEANYETRARRQSLFSCARRYTRAMDGIARRSADDYT